MLPKKEVFLIILFTWVFIECISFEAAQIKNEKILEVLRNMRSLQQRNAPIQKFRGRAVQNLQDQEDTGASSDALLGTQNVAQDPEESASYPQNLNHQNSNSHQPQLLDTENGDESSLNSHMNQNENTDESPQNSQEKIDDTQQNPINSNKNPDPNAPRAKNGALLDFPEYEERTENSPILDFPDPQELAFKSKSRSHKTACNEAESQANKNKVPIKKRKEVVAHQVRTQNRQLQQALIFGYLDNNTMVPTEPVNGFKLLDKTATVFMSFCKEKYLPKRFVDSVVYAFKKLHEIATPGRTEYLPDEKFKWIDEALDKCQNSSKGYLFFQDECHEEIRAWKSSKNWLCTKWSDDINPRVYDPLLDLIWHFYNGVYYYCLDYFKDSYETLHTYGTAIMDLYSSAVKLRWNHQIESEPEFWFRILGPNYILYARNIEKCTQAPIESVEMQVMMPRYTLPGSVRYAKLFDDEENNTTKTK